MNMGGDNSKVISVKLQNIENRKMFPSFGTGEKITTFFFSFARKILTMTEPFYSELPLDDQACCTQG